MEKINICLCVCVCACVYKYMFLDSQPDLLNLPKLQCINIEEVLTTVGDVFGWITDGFYCNKGSHKLFNNSSVNWITLSDLCASMEIFINVSCFSFFC